jgi:hypothetical protein
MLTREVNGIFIKKAKWGTIHDPDLTDDIDSPRLS